MKVKLLLFVCFLTGSILQAQKFSEDIVQLKNLAGVTEYQVIFDYKNLKVDHFETEEDFLKDKMDKRKEDGRDESFRINWFADRENKYEPRFLEAFQKQIKKKAVAGKENEKATHQILIKTDKIIPGYNIGVAKKPAYIDVTVTIYPKDTPTQLIYKAKISNLLGYSNFFGDYNSGDRIALAYERLGNALGKKIKKAIK